MDSHTNPLDQWAGLERLRRDYPITPTSLVIDFGAYEGEFIEDIRKLYGCKIIAYEPTPERANVLLSRYSHDPNIAIHPLAVSYRNGPLTLYEASDRTGEYAQGVEVQVQGIDASEAILGPVDLLKVNIEGSEYDVIDRLYVAGKLPMVHHLQVQFHPWPADYEERYARITDRLRESHSLQWRAPFIWESWSRTT